MKIYRVMEGLLSDVTARFEAPNFHGRLRVENAVKQICFTVLPCRRNRNAACTFNAESFDSPTLQMIAPNKLKGILFMLSSTALFVLGDTFMKLASTDLPANQLTFLRAIVSLVAFAGLITVWSQWSGIATLARPKVALRGLAEACAAVLFTLGLAHLAIADLFAIVLTVPLFLLLGATIIFRDRLSPVQILLVIIGFGGAMFVAQPGLDGLSQGMLYAFAAATCVAARDLIGRGVPAHYPVAVVAVATTVIIIVLAGAILIATKEWNAPSWLNLFYVSLAGVCVAAGQTAVVLAFRNADTITLAPLFYSLAVWGVLSGLLIWGELPNALAMFGIVLIIVSGVALVWVGERARSLTGP
jgi:drug/metabolite transporter (DMT)-like permease